MASEINENLERTMKEKNLEVPKLPKISQMSAMMRPEMTVVDKPKLKKAVKVEFAKLFMKKIRLYTDQIADSYVKGLYKANGISVDGRSQDADERLDWSDAQSASSDVSHG